MSYRVKLLKREELASSTFALYLERPKGFEFHAGQNIDISLVDHEKIEPGGSGRTFSIASAPYQDELMVAVRYRDNKYKQALYDLPIGGELIIDGPFGKFHLDKEQDRPAVFIIGGIGITPALSMIRQAVYDNDQRPLYLFYSNRRTDLAAFDNELQAMENECDNFRYIPIITRPELSKTKWTGETEHISGNLLKKYIDDLSEPYYYIVGTSSMLWDTIRTLSDHIDREQIRVEDFTGFN